MIKRIQIEPVLCDYLYYKFNICESYRKVIENVLADNRGIDINEESFNKYKEEYRNIFSEVELMKSEILKEYFLSENKNVRDYTYMIDFINHELVVELKEE